MNQLLLLVVLLALAACSVGPPPPPGQIRDSDRDALTLAIMRLGPGVAYDEAKRISSVAYTYPHVLLRDYQAKLGALNARRPPVFDIKTPAVCAKWADRHLQRLLQEAPRTLDLRMAMADPSINTPFAHSTVVVTAKGAPLTSGLVLDGCRRSGNLYWKLVTDDRYRWRPQSDMLWDRTFGRKPWYARTPLEGRLVRPDPLAP
ncbi:hypothetical protein KO516_16860 [Citreicella sp. C3M06]|uniref:hypothetical protein n=1 Tax=Citreicella sp. C3M06 TaxID=2841564 RepID=UPI001C096ECD|nr:hypothetical protein [Citreicella sp. C3M06]MBU2962462.1 hypothetical protein [Citreicella sp. C3M06]